MPLWGLLNAQGILQPTPKPYSKTPEESMYLGRHGHLGVRLRGSSGLGIGSQAVWLRDASSLGGGGGGGLSEGVEGGLGRLLPVVERLGLKACLRALGLKEAPALFKDDRGFDAVSRKPRLNGSGCQ